MRKIFLYFVLKYQGDWNKVFIALKTGEAVLKEDYLRVTKEFNGNFVTLIDPSYPSCFRKYATAPFVIFYEGNLELLNDDANNVGVVGGYTFTEEGEHRVEEVVYKINDDNANVVTILDNSLNDYAFDFCREEQINVIGIAKNGIRSFKQNHENTINDLNTLIFSDCYFKSKGEQFYESEELLACCVGQVIVPQIDQAKDILIIASQVSLEMKKIYYWANEEIDFNREFEFKSVNAIAINSVEDIV